MSQCSCPTFNIFFCHFPKTHLVLVIKKTGTRCAFQLGVDSPVEGVREEALDLNDTTCQKNCHRSQGCHLTSLVKLQCCHFTRFTLGMENPHVSAGTLQYLSSALLIPKRGIQPSFNQGKIHRFRTSQPWATPGPTVKRPMKEKKFTFKDSLRKSKHSAMSYPVGLLSPLPPSRYFSVLPRQRPCFDVIRLDNWGDVVDLACNHGNNR